MKIYADYGFYVEQYKGSAISAEDFDEAIFSASQYIRYLTMSRSDSYLGEEVKYAACAVADVYHAVYFPAKVAGVGESVKKSENTDGYSVSYVVEGNDGETKERLFQRKAYEKARIWLICTGLLNRKVGCGHDYKC